MKDVNYIQPNLRDLWQIFSVSEYFKHPNFQVLDFGCNRGNFIGWAYRNTQGKALEFKPSNYTGIDLNLSAVEQARKTFPRCAPNIIHYNKYHRSYNPAGDKNIDISETMGDKKFDLIVAYSVFTHFTTHETRETLKDLTKLLKNNGSILFTMWMDQSRDNFYKHITTSQGLEQTPERTNALVETDYKDCIYWINLEKSVTDVDHIETEDLDSFGVFYKNPRAVLNIMPGIEYLGVPGPNNQQHLFRYGSIS